jgi:putative oxidoreductase
MLSPLIPSIRTRGDGSGFYESSMNAVTAAPRLTSMVAMSSHTVAATSPTLDARLSSRSAVALGVFRIAVALLFMVHGTTKLFGWPTGSPAALGAWPMWWAGVLEVVLGLLIAVGLYARAAAFVASGMMAVAYFWRHFPESFWPSVNGGDAAVLFCFVFLLLVFTGTGALTASRR